MKNKIVPKLRALVSTIETMPELTCIRETGEGCDGCAFQDETKICDVLGRKANYLIENGVTLKSEIPVVLARHVHDLVDGDCGICPAVTYCGEHGLNKTDCAGNLLKFYEEREEL